MAKLSDKWQTNIKWLCDQHPSYIYHNKRSISNGIWYKSLFDCVCCSLVKSPHYASHTHTHLSPCLYYLSFFRLPPRNMVVGTYVGVFYEIGWQKPIKLLRYLEHTLEQITENHHSPCANKTKQKIVSLQIKHICIGDFTLRAYQKPQNKRNSTPKWLIHKNSNRMWWTEYFVHATCEI